MRINASISKAIDEIDGRPGERPDHKPVRTPHLAPEERHILELVRETDVREIAAQRGVTSSLESLVADLERRADSVAHREPDEAEAAAGTFASSTERSLRLLRATIHLDPPRIAPALDPAAQLGHTYPLACEHLDTDASGAHEMLESLADLGLLQRTLANRVHLCPACERCQINFREQCTRCASIDLSIERVLHHFRCGHIGIESEYQSGQDLECPKCRRELHQLGQDFDRPHETYVCHDCGTLSEEPNLSGQCLSCTHEFSSHEAQQRAIYAYVPTPLALRAVELGRLTGLDVDAILYDAELKLATCDFLDFEIKRELVRIGRQSTAFTTATLSFERAGRTVPFFREWSRTAVRDVCSTLAGSLRTLDLVARLDDSRFGILMPEADAQGAEVVRHRLFRLLRDVDFVDPAGNEFTPVWTVTTWTDSGVQFEDVQSFLAR